MGIIMGALGGLGEAAGNVGASFLKSGLDEEREKNLATLKSGLDLKREMDFATFKNTMAVNTANAERTAQVGRIDAAQKGIVGGITAGNANKFYGDDTNLTDADLSDEEKAAFAATPDQVRHTRTEAGIATGDIKPEVAATLDYKGEALLYKSLYEQGKEEGKDRRADARLESQEKIAADRNESAERRSDARLAVMVSKIGHSGGGNPTKEALAFVDGARKETASEAANLKALFAAEMQGKSPTKQAEIKAEYAPKFADIDRKRAQVELDFNNLRERVGLSPAAGQAAPATAKPAAAPAASAPSRASQFKVIR